MSCEHNPVRTCDLCLERLFMERLAIETNGIVDGGVPSATEIGNISLRDWFAGMAMQSLLVHPDRQHWSRGTVIIRSYEVADYMLEVRERNNETLPPQD